MSFLVGLCFPGLVLLSCCNLVQSGNPQANPVPTASNNTNHTSPPPVVKVGNVTTAAPNVTSPTAVPSNVTASSTRNTTIIYTNTTTITTKNTTGKANATQTTLTPAQSPHVTAVIPKTPPTSNSTSATATAKAPGNLSRLSGFDVGSFIGGIVLTLGLLVIGYIGCRTYHAKRGVQYRTIDEHDAII